MYLTLVQPLVVTQSKLFIARDCVTISKIALLTKWFSIADEDVNWLSDVGENLNLSGFRPWNELKLYRMRWHTCVPQQVVNNAEDHDMT